MRKYRIVRQVTAALVLTSLVSCTTAVLPEGPPDIVGTITQVDREIPPRWFVVEENPEDSSGSAKARVTMRMSTRVLRQVGTGIEVADHMAVIRGESARVWFDGPIAESYPVQVDAGVVLIDTVR